MTWSLKEIQLSWAGKKRTWQEIKYKRKRTGPLCKEAVVTLMAMGSHGSVQQGSDMIGPTFWKVYSVEGTEYSTGENQQVGRTINRI